MNETTEDNPNHASFTQELMYASVLSIHFSKHPFIASSRIQRSISDRSTSLTSRSKLHEKARNSIEAPNLTVDVGPGELPVKVPRVQISKRINHTANR